MSKLSDILERFWTDAGDYWGDSDVGGPMPEINATDRAEEAIQALIDIEFKRGFVAGFGRGLREGKRLHETMVTTPTNKPKGK